MKKNKINVGVIFGGRSGEHEVSVVSARSVMSALDRKKYNVIPIGITKKGQWIGGPRAIKYLKEGIKNLNFQWLLSVNPDNKSIVAIKQENNKPAKVSKDESVENIDVIFPVMHGPFGEDGSIQGLLEMANIPYVGSGVLGSAVSMDKIIQKKLFLSAGLPQVDFIWFLSKDWPKISKKIIVQTKKLKYPFFIKPANLGSSVGITKAHNKQELIAGINLARNYDRKILVEQGIENVREIECSVLGNDFPKASVPGEIISSNEFYDYDAKYIDNKSKAIIPAKLPEKVIKKIQELSITSFKTLDLSGMARVDFFISKDNQIYINEVNTIPGFTSISMYPKLWEATGLNFAALLDELINLAIKRSKEKNKLFTSFTPKTNWHAV